MVFERIGEYELFHIHRIISVLLECEFPANTHGKNGKSENGSYLVRDRIKKIEWIISSLAELRIISVDESHLVKEYLTSKIDSPYSIAFDTICRKYKISQEKLEDVLASLKI